MNDTYYNEQKIKNTQRCREIVKELPSFCGDYFRAVEYTTSALTRLNYAHDLKIFFNYLINEIPYFSEKSIKNISSSDLDNLVLRDYEIYVEYLGYYCLDGKEFKNDERGVARKLASLRSFYKYLYKKSLIKNNVPALLDMPKRHEKSIIYLTGSEISNLLSVVENGDGLTERQKKLHQKTVKRDMAIIVTFLTTGIRVSELVGLNVSDIDFENLSFKVIRKGGNEMILYFDYETYYALKEYIEEREQNDPDYTEDSPLFISLQKKRINVRSVENIIKKYARIAAPLKKISPHKLRSTYGTMLYDNTGDIYMVAEVLGHKDVNTTKKHYAAMSDIRRREAAKAVKLSNMPSNEHIKNDTESG